MVLSIVHQNQWFFLQRCYQIINVTGIMNLFIIKIGSETFKIFSEIYFEKGNVITFNIKNITIIL